MGQPDTREPRDRYVDFLRAGSLLVVVVWHWVFSVVSWGDTGPHASNPIATTSGLWVLTWLLQVMPLFFFVGGFAHLRTWESVRRAGGGAKEFYERRLGRLLLPTLACLCLVGAARIAFGVAFPDVGWVNRGFVLLLSPLWFLGVYVMIVLLAPLTLRLHDRLGPVMLVALAAAAAWVDLLRFHFDHPTIAWLNFVVVWALCHQLGYFWPRLVAGGRQLAWSLALGGLAALSIMTNMGLYPRSMVGVPGEEFSNMGPPTLCIVALMLFQAGLVLLLRPTLTGWLERPVPARLAAWANANSMTVFLWHLTGYAIAYAVLRWIGLHAPEDTTPWWWAQRPLWLLAPLVATVPLVRLFRRFEGRSGQAGGGAPAPAAAFDRSRSGSR